MQPLIENGCVVSHLILKCSADDSFLKMHVGGKWVCVCVEVGDLAHTHTYTHWGEETVSADQAIMGKMNKWMNGWGLNWWKEQTNRLRKKEKARNQT